MLMCKARKEEYSKGDHGSIKGKAILKFGADNLFPLLSDSDYQSAADLQPPFE